MSHFEGTRTPPAMGRPDAATDRSGPTLNPPERIPIMRPTDAPLLDAHPILPGTPASVLVGSERPWTRDLEAALERVLRSRTGTGAPPWILRPRGGAWSLFRAEPRGPASLSADREAWAAYDEALVRLGLPGCPRVGDLGTEADPGPDPGPPPEGPPPACPCPITRGVRSAMDRLAEGVPAGSAVESGRWWSRAREAVHLAERIRGMARDESAPTTTPLPGPQPPAKDGPLGRTLPFRRVRSAGSPRG